MIPGSAGESVVQSHVPYPPPADHQVKPMSQFSTIRDERTLDEFILRTYRLPHSADAGRIAAIRDELLRRNPTLERSGRMTPGTLVELPPDPTAGRRGRPASDSGLRLGSDELSTQEPSPRGDRLADAAAALDAIRAGFDAAKERAETTAKRTAALLKEPDLRAFVDPGSALENELKSIAGASQTRLEEAQASIKLQAKAIEALAKRVAARRGGGT